MDNRQEETELIIITGMSGAGKTVAIQSFEDLGFFTIDNLPPALLPTFIKLMRDSGKSMKRVAAVMDLRGGDFFDSLVESIDHLSQEPNVSITVLFLDAENQTLVSRYKETRRSHPLSPGGLVLGGIKKERDMLSDLQGRAQFKYNTSNMSPRELKEKIIADFSSKTSNVFTVNVMSFGFKHGMPIDADLVFDVRFLPNPYYIEELNPLSGLDERVSSYVLKWQETQTLIEKLTDLLQFMIPQYKNEGKAQLVIAFGCTGGQHRSVTLAEYYGKLLAENNKVIITHRDVKIRKD
ncbi:RNase adapter RapZ [Microbacterium sp. APC 3898]|uniref:RNase adapter RapZ n=2 Tax=Planococcus TaxID=1372 RepID=A0ABT7ZNN0_9BACL|nr:MULTISPECIES: RNase adapter RapZ [Terrabacteria group]MBD8016375.1 RNase adapter RapZ [Planococcus wigleyi]MDN3428774.1 RNase adapter RapZ [Planococcus sp. APC 4016]MDN3439289.1 RNase adapter RapZ [Planococcus sp. APC 3900]MDN3500105.1 RNase adapter RapZ [Microbacterium sp. APC 3898]